uniref:Histone chaperone domain-containing protein n=1 Tax=Mola mola TaxID=94237 RepID=A0A3Q3X1D6_MOLML
MKSFHFLCFRTESKDKEDHKKTDEGSEEEEQIKSGSEEEEQGFNKTRQKKNRKMNHLVHSEEPADEESKESGMKENERRHGDNPKEGQNGKASTTKNEETGSGKRSQEKKTRTFCYCAEEKPSGEKKNNDPDSDSSSLPSLEDDVEDRGRENVPQEKKKKTQKKEKKEKSDKGQKGDNKAVVRLKRYIALCGVRHNYKKLLDGCRSVRSQVALLKKELEDLGVHGQPSIKKCKMVRMKREEAQELAHLDVSNIIATQGRSKRRGTLAWREQQKPPSPQYTRTLNSGSDSEDNQAHGGRRKTTDWANLQGIISDDADSN